MPLHHYTGSDESVNMKEMTLAVLSPPDILADTVTPYNVRTHRVQAVLDYNVWNENVTCYSLDQTWVHFFSLENKHNSTPG